MSISESLLPEFDQEMANTRKVLERIPEDKFDWKPHPKSYSLGQLATHLANLPTWTQITINEDSFDTNPPGESGPPRTVAATSREEVLQRFDQNITAARAAIAGAGDEKLMQPWSLLSGGKTVFTLPRLAVLRTFVMNHNIHHRAQLGVYLRLNEVPLPSIYGPTADEG